MHLSHDELRFFLFSLSTLIWFVSGHWSIPFTSAYCWRTRAALCCWVKRINVRVRPQKSSQRRQRVLAGHGQLCPCPALQAPSARPWTETSCLQTARRLALIPRPRKKTQLLSITLFLMVARVSLVASPSATACYPFCFSSPASLDRFD